MHAHMYTHNIHNADEVANSPWWRLGLLSAHKVDMGLHTVDEGF